MSSIPSFPEVPIITTIGTFNNLDLTSYYIKFTGIGQVIITGINSSKIYFSSKSVKIFNNTQNPLILKSNSELSKPGNRLILDQDYSLPDKGSIQLTYFSEYNGFLITDTDNTGGEAGPPFDISKVIKYGVVIIQADGFTTDFYIPHGFINQTPRSVNVIAGNIDAAGLSYFSNSDSTNIIISFPTPPESGSLIYYWQVFL